jgi:quercetin dioxygenase-like cupin family protein
MKNFFQALLVAITFSLAACNNTATTDNANTGTADTNSTSTNNADESMPAYDQAMDPLTVEAQFAKKLADTLNVKMYEITLKPGDSAMVHTHPDYSLYVLEGGKLAVTTQGADRQELDLQKGMGLVSGSQTHSAKNIGKTTVRLLVHDIYRPRGNR